MAKKKEKVIAKANGLVWIHKGRCDNSLTVGCLEDGEEVEILEIEDDICKIEGGYYIRKEFLSF